MENISEGRQHIPSDVPNVRMPNAFKIIGISEDVAWMVANKLFAVIKAPLYLIFIITFLTPREQGTWYAFTNLAALSMLAELGFSGIITQFVSHEFAHLKEEGGILKGGREKLDRIFSLIRFSLKFYLVIVPAAIIGLISVGFFYFGKKIDATFIAWMLFSAIGGIALLSSLLQAIYQGLDKVKKIQQNLLIGAIGTTLCVAGFLFLKTGIWALVIGNATGLMLMIGLLYLAEPRFWRQLFCYKISDRHNWTKDVVGLQGKYAVTFISGYLIFFLFVPVIYKYNGPVLAGQFGATLAIVSSITGLACAWVSSKVPKFNIMVAQRRRADLNDCFRVSFFASLIMFGLSAGMFLLGLLILGKFTSYGMRFLDLADGTLLLLTQLPTVIVGNLAIYLRAHKEEPYYGLSVLNAAFTVLCVFIILPIYGFREFLFSLLLVNLLISLPVALFIYFRCKDRIFPRKYYIA